MNDLWKKKKEIDYCQIYSSLKMRIPFAVVAVTLLINQSNKQQESESFLNVYHLKGSLKQPEKIFLILLLRKTPRTNELFKDLEIKKNGLLINGGLSADVVNDEHNQGYSFVLHKSRSTDSDVQILQWIQIIQLSRMMLALKSFQQIDKHLIQAKI